MLRSNQILLVYPVPFAALDAGGMPAAAIRFDPPTGRRSAVHFIGCTRESVLVERRRREEGRQSIYAITFQYDISPQRITHTDHHMQRIQHGELIPADAATAKLARVPFVPPATAFERARYAAIQRWEQEYGFPPPVEAWPELRLIVPDSDAPSTAPAHGASMRAKGVVPVAAPEPQAPAAPVAAPHAEERLPLKPATGAAQVAPPTALAGRSPALPTNVARGAAPVEAQQVAPGPGPEDAQAPGQRAASNEPLLIAGAAGASPGGTTT